MSLGHILRNPKEFCQKKKTQKNKYSLKFCDFNSFFFDKNKRYSFIQIDRVHRYNRNLNPLKPKRMNL